MRNFEHYREEMNNGEMPVDVETAERATSAHIALKKKILGAPIEHIQNEAEKVKWFSREASINFVTFRSLNLLKLFKTFQELWWGMRKSWSCFVS